jgi:hypothetical protein
MPEGSPLLAARRPLFFQHVPNVPKADLSEGEHVALVEAERLRTGRLMASR